MDPGEAFSFCEGHVRTILWSIVLLRRQRGEKTGCLDEVDFALCDVCVEHLNVLVMKRVSRSYEPFVSKM